MLANISDDIEIAGLLSHQPESLDTATGVETAIGPDDENQAATELEHLIGSPQLEDDSGEDSRQRTLNAETLHNETVEAEEGFKFDDETLLESERLAEIALLEEQQLAERGEIESASGQDATHQQSASDLELEEQAIDLELKELLEATAFAEQDGAKDIASTHPETVLVARGSTESSGIGPTEHEQAGEQAKTVTAEQYPFESPSNDSEGVLDITGAEDVAVLQAPATASLVGEKSLTPVAAELASPLEIGAKSEHEFVASKADAKPKKMPAGESSQSQFVADVPTEEFAEEEPIAEPVVRGWRAKAAVLLAKALGKETPKPAVARPAAKKRAARKKTSANTDGITAKPRAKRKPRAKVQPAVKKGLFGRVLARIGFGDDEPVVAPKPKRRATSTATEGRTAPRKPRAASKKRTTAKKAPAKKGLFGRVMARFGLGEEEPALKPRARKPVDPNAPKKPRKPRATTSADGTAKRKRSATKKTSSKSALQKALDSVVGGWRSLRQKK